MRQGVIVAMVLAIILSLGFGLRAHSALRWRADYKGHSDALVYGRIANHLYMKKTFSTGSGPKKATDYSPGLPFFLAGAYFIFGWHPKLGMLMLALASSLMAALVFALGRRLHSTGAGLIAAFLTAIYPAYIWFAKKPAAEPLGALWFTATLLALLWAASQRRLLSWALPGVLFGLTVFTRPEFLAVTPLFAILICIHSSRNQHTDTTTKSRIAAGVIAPALFLATFALVIAPWTVRNYQLFDRFVPISTGGGKALYIGTNLPGGGNHNGVKELLAKRFLTTCKPGESPAYCYDPAHVKDLAPAPLLNKVAQKYPNLSRDNALAKLGKENIREYALGQPLAYAKMTAGKVIDIWGVGAGKTMKAPGWIVFQLTLLLLAIIGAITMWRRRQRFELAFLLSAPVVITGVGSILLAVPRRVLPVQSVTLILAGIAIMTIISYILSRRAPQPAHEEIITTERERPVAA
jgi:4-amino-4-deoxy-L-arabinose transferase-like glycosyltransferase